MYRISNSIATLDIAVTLFALYLLNRIFRGKRRAPLPPGPRRLPFLGNLLDMPKEHEWKTFAAWGDRWGDIVSIDVLGKTMIILNSAKSAIDMLDKKSAIYSDRPHLVMANELCGWDTTLVMLHSGPKFREYRRILHAGVGSKSNIVDSYPTTEQQVYRFLHRVLDNPDDIVDHIRWSAGTLILNLTYGYQAQECDDPIIDVVDRALQEFSIVAMPGAFLVDVLPILKYIPEWLPGGSFKKTAKTYRAHVEEMARLPYDFVREQMAAGTALPSLVHNHLQIGKRTKQDEETLKWAAASLYSGGSDTTVSSIYTFILAMTLHAKIQKRAQAELDAVVGKDRLPLLSDRERLPYVEVIIQEVFRWHPIGPLGIPHVAKEDDVHDGYFIPKGSLVIANIWKFLHDPTVYSNPSEFNPDRFIPSDNKCAEPDPRNLIFGFGRRVCPGSKVADASVFISCASLLAVFDISKTLDEQGRTIEPLCEYTSGTISHPKPFRCTIKPRSASAEALIRSTASSVHMARF